MLKRIYIQNFRSIKELEFFPTNMCAFVGPNSTGKTNILKAIDLVLGEGWTTKAKVARELFNDPSKEINIEIEFTKSLDYKDKYGRLSKINRITLCMRLDPNLYCETRLWTLDDEEKWMNDEFKKSCNFIYIPSDRNLSDQMRVSNWTLLGKMMKEIHENYIKHYEGNESALKADFADLMQPAKDFLEDDFLEDGVTFKKFVETFTKYCSINSAGLANGFIPQLNIYNLNWFYKTLQIAVQEGGTPKLFDSEEVGAGMQNLILLSIFQSYAELMKDKVIMAIEEPELYLYPQAQRELYKTFNKLSEDTQIFYTTHNQNFVDASRAYEVQMLQRNEKQGTYLLIKDEYVTPTNAEKLKHLIYTQFNTERNEIFFAKKVLLVEGASDKILWTTLAQEKWSIDLDREGISVIECSGKGGVIYFAGFCRIMGIEDYFVTWDGDDDSESTVEDKNNILPNSLSEGKGFEIEGNLEKFLRKKFPVDQYPKYKFTQDDKVENAYNWASTVDRQLIPSEFDVIKDFLKPESKIQTEIIIKRKEKLEESIRLEVHDEVVEEIPDDIPF